MRRQTSFIGIVLIAVLITVGQIVFSIVAESADGGRASYASLFQFDSEWYADIAENGYRSALPPAPEPLPQDNDVIVRETNAAFFPAYPLLGRLVQLATGLPTEPVLLIVAQLAAVGFWTCWLLLLRRLGIQRNLRIAATTAAVVHPSAFFLVAAYSESLFLLGLFGLMLSTLSSHRFWWLWSGFFGFLMSFTRLPGLVFAAIPLVIRPLVRPSVSESFRIPKAATASFLSAMGSLSFFIFCARTFGRWNLYMIRQHGGWGIESDPLFILHNKLPLIPYSSNPAFWSSDGMSIVITALTTWLLVCACIATAVFIRKQTTKDWTLLVIVLLMASIFFYCNGSALWSINMRSMIRYVFVTHLLLFLWAAMLMQHFPRPKATIRRTVYGLFIACVIASASLQFILVERFTDAQWVA